MTEYISRAPANTRTHTHTMQIPSDSARALQPGDLLKWSEAAIRPLRDWWLTQGRHEPKENAKASLDAKSAERMTYLRTVKGRFCTFIEYRQGVCEGRCMPHMAERAND